MKPIKQLLKHIKDNNISYILLSSLDKFEGNSKLKSEGLLIRAYDKTNYPITLIIKKTDDNKKQISIQSEIIEVINGNSHHTVHTFTIIKIKIQKYSSYVDDWNIFLEMVNAIEDFTGQSLMNYDPNGILDITYYD